MHTRPRKAFLNVRVTNSPALATLERFFQEETEEKAAACLYIHIFVLYIVQTI